MKKIILFTTLLFLMFSFGVELLAQEVLQENILINRDPIQIVINYLKFLFPIILISFIIGIPFILITKLFKKSPEKEFKGSSVKTLSTLFKIFAFLYFILAFITLLSIISSPNLLIILFFILYLIGGVVYLFISYGLSEEKRWAWFSSLILLSGGSFLYLISKNLIGLLFIIPVLFLLIKARKTFLEKPKEPIIQQIRDHRFLITIIGILLMFFITGLVIALVPKEEVKILEEKTSEELIEEQIIKEEIIEYETADWKVYYYNEYGFQISYPLDWTSNISISFEEGALVFSSPKDTQGNSIFFSIQRYDLDKGGFGYPSLSAPNTVIDGIKAYKDEGYVRNPDGPSIQGIWLKKDNFVYNLTFKVYKKYNLPSKWKYEDIAPAIFTSEEEKIRDAFVSTFKFIETDKVVEDELILEEIVLLNREDFNLEEWDIQKVEVGGWGDSKLILINKETKEEKVLINSTDELRDYIGQQEEFNINGLLKYFGAIFLIGSYEEGNEIYFMLNYDYGGPIFSLNMNSLDIKEIKNADFFASSEVYSPRGNKAVVLEEESPAVLLYLICFNTDTKIPVVTLKEGETFEERIRELDRWYYIKFLDEKTIEYKVYKKENKTGNTFIEIRTIQLPNC